MIATPVFKRTYDVCVVDPEGVYLLSERWPVLLKGPVFCRLAPLLDGARTADQIVDALAAEIPPLQVRIALAFLEGNGHIVEAHAGLPPARLAMWDDLGVDAGEAEQRLRTTAVTVRACGDVLLEPVVAALEAHGVRVTETGSMNLILSDDYLNPALTSINAAALADRTPWLLARPVGTTVWIGPVFTPGQTGCWECLAQRLRLNRTVERYLQRRVGRAEGSPVARAVLPGTAGAGVALVAVETVRAIAAPQSALGDRIATIDLLGRRVEHHTLVRRPQCAACGEPIAEPRPIQLESRAKTFVADGGHRAGSPSAMLERYGHHVSWLSGAVRQLEASPIAEAPSLHIVDSGENRAATAGTLDVLRYSFRSRAGGKGVTESQARASALGEALERYSGLHQGDEPRILASHRELADRAVHPNAVMLFSDSQYRHRDEWNARGSRFCRVPEPFDENAALDWTPLWSLTHQTMRYLPTAFCYYGTGEIAGNRWSVPSSNGCAAGTTLEEAILQGFLELVERDAVGLWWYNRVRRPAVDLDTFDEPYFAAIRAEYARLSRDIWVLDVTTDLGIPSFAALSRRVDQPEHRLVFGFGAHLDPRIGLLRALTEMNQCLPWAWSDLTPDGAGDHGDDMKRWQRVETLQTQPHFVPADGPIKTASSYARQWSDDLRDDVRRCQGIVESKGLEMLVLDQTRPDIGLPVVRVVVPGLRHFWARFAPGRLYDVPVALEWLSQPVDEESLNPIAMFW
jgi:bacteriocin biosynthesis cyclodehydratase domain-containing protein